jgi:gluconolactonase
MKTRIILVLLGFIAFGYYACSDIDAFDVPSPITEPFENLRIIKEGFSFTEGPAVDKDGNVFFTDQPNDKIWKWDAETDEVTLWLEGTGRANGMAFDKDGNLITCSDMYGEVWKIKPDKSHTVLVNNYNGKLLNGPNDVWVNPVTGGLYITDPMFPRSYWEATDPRKVNNPNWPPTKSEQAATGKGGHVYYLAPGATSLVRVTTMSSWAADSWPNGVVGTPDGKKLYVNKWAANNLGGTWEFTINEDGTLTLVKQVTTTGGDGMSMDEKGNIYISNGLGVKVVDPKLPSAGAVIMTIPVSATGGGATNNVFAGKDQKTLLITGPVDKITSIKTYVRGVEKF